MNFLKTYVRNSLEEGHLNDAVRLKASKHTMKKFPYDVALEIFLPAKDRRGLNITMDHRAGPSDADIDIEFSILEPEFEDSEDMLNV
eukprot:jgi/Botrbrau1/8400/Bobra.0237s0021.1